MTATLESDIIDTVAGLDPDSLLAVLRRRRPEALRHTEGSYQALLHPADTGGVTAAERAAIARRVAELNLDTALGAHYASVGAEAAGEAEPGRLGVILNHVDLLTREPKAATPADLDALRTAGLTDRDIVMVSQLVAFINHQVRLLAGFRLLGAAS
jgi:uncharacterized protein YciW